MVSSSSSTWLPPRPGAARPAPTPGPRRRMPGLQGNARRLLHHSCVSAGSDWSMGVFSPFMCGQGISYLAWHDENALLHGGRCHHDIRSGARGWRGTSVTDSDMSREFGYFTPKFSRLHFSPFRLSDWLIVTLSLLVAPAWRSYSVIPLTWISSHKPSLNSRQTCGTAFRSKVRTQITSSLCQAAQPPRP